MQRAPLIHDAAASGDQRAPMVPSDFLNPRSMLTPGIAGGITMMIANSLWVQFALEPKWSALVISFVLALVVFAADNIPVWERAIYYVLNALIIFSVGVGTNYLGTRASDSEMGLLDHISVAYGQDTASPKEKQDVAPSLPAEVTPDSPAVGQEEHKSVRPPKTEKVENANQLQSTDVTGLKSRQFQKFEDRTFFKQW